MIDYLELLEEDVNPEDIDVSSIKFHSELNPILWAKIDGEYYLRDEIKTKLTAIADKFSDFIRYKGSKIDVKDIVLTGSNCNYNYSPTSDLDLHLMVDYSSVGDEPELVSEYLFNKKVLWGLKYDIKVSNIPVECYAAEADSDLVKGAAYYSLMKGEWIVKPDRKNIVVDLSAVKEKAAELIEMVNRAETADQIKKLKDRLYKMRYAGLHSSGEFSVETLAYKILRNSGVLDQMNERLSALEAL
jgi:hypothetical protein